jgi:hypothetical protein
MQHMDSVLNSQYPPLAATDGRVATLNEAAVYTGISISGLKRAANRGELRILRLSPRRVGIRLADLRAFLDSRGITLRGDKDAPQKGGRP